MTVGPVASAMTPGRRQIIAPAMMAFPLAQRKRIVSKELRIGVVSRATAGTHALACPGDEAVRILLKRSLVRTKSVPGHLIIRARLAHSGLPLIETLKQEDRTETTPRS